MTNQEQRDNELLYLLSEGLSEYLQGYKLEQGGPAFDTLDTASLNLTPELGRQGFKTGGGIGEVFSNISDTVSEISSNVPATAQAAIGFAATTAAKGLTPVGLLGLGIDLASVAFTGKTATSNIMGAITNPAAYKGTITYSSFPTGIEEDTPPGVTTTQADRQANIAETGTATGLGTSISGAQGQQFGYSDIDPTTSTAPATDPNTDFPDDPQEVDVTPGETASTPDIADQSQATADTSGEADASTGDVSADASVGDYGGAQGDSALQEGGQIKGYREGDLVEDDQADTQLDTLGLGPIGIVDDPDGTTGVADDLDMALPHESYVINTEGTNETGRVSINKMLREAIDMAIADGVDLPSVIKTAEKVPIKISKGETAIPYPLPNYIGLSKLEKINTRGLRIREQRENEEAPVQMAAAPSAQEDLLAQIQPVA